MSKLHNFLLFLCTIVPFLTHAQEAEVLGNAVDKQSITNYDVLPDRGYTIDRVSADSALVFVQRDVLQPKRDSACWLRVRVANPGPYSQACVIQVLPKFFNTLYYRQAGSRAWKAVPGGMEGPVTGTIYKSYLPFVLRAGTTDTLYIKVSLRGLERADNAIKPALYWRTMESHTIVEQHVLTVWDMGAAIIILFILNYLYIYRDLREKVILYLVIAQFGGLLYITSYWLALYRWFPMKIFTRVVTPRGEVNSYDVNFLLMHISVVLVMYGMVQLTRSFLLTETRLPRLDAWLKYSLRAYLLFELVLACINVFIAQVNYITLPYDNLFCLLILIIILITSIKAFVRRFPAAGPYLFANLVPLVLMAGISLLHVFTSIDTTGDWLPLLAIITQSLGYSIALVAFIRYLRLHLQQKEQEAQLLAMEIQELNFRHQLITVENQQISLVVLDEKNKNNALVQKLEANQRELASNTLYLAQKNEMLEKLKGEITDLTKQHPDISPQKLSGISSILRSHQHLDSEWEKFKIHFEQVHPGFFEDLELKYPTLTRNEARLYAYFHIRLSTKEIATLLNIDPASVRQAKMRLHKKLASFDRPKAGSMDAL
ncbi:hypothetical protein [Dyadobacter jiangsuensis]|uniref:7TMR-DISM extracellular protein 2 n=1 Tax=Dyadobacter jiangsuensis TaxID=1591085 RepID=A0A2P8GIG1_9BACT|nr:hypothetical protein [Dyadobacter jiangsuensis]PSL33762.1 hypothetical protein CLV60_101131 [Dyadobacter jiangsuensis]